MSGLFGFIAFAAFIALIVGLAKPELFASIPWWKKANKIPTRKDTSILFAGVFIGSLIITGATSDGTKSNSKDSNEKSSTAETKPPEKVGKPDQVALHTVLKTYKDKYSKADGDMAKSKVFREYVDEIRKQVPGGIFKDWEGKIDRIETTEGGTLAEVEIECEYGDYEITVQTNNNRLSDFGENTMIKLNSPVYKMLEILKKGDKVKFSGKLVPDPKRGFRVIALTERGVLDEQKYIAWFNTITKL